MSNLRAAFPSPHHGSSAPLAYAAQRPWHARIPRKYLIAGAIVLAVGISSIAWGELAWLKLQLLYWQSRCMSHAAPPTQVVESRQMDPQWQRFTELLAPPGLQSAGTIYLHERVSPGGNRRLIAVSLRAACGNGADAHVALPHVIIPGGLFSRPREVQCETPLWMPYEVRVYAGQSDLQNPSHFTFVIDTDERQHVVDGWLGDDDTVKLEPRTPID
jgi:hypothetical protein